MAQTLHKPKDKQFFEKLTIERISYMENQIKHAIEEFGLQVILIGLHNAMAHGGPIKNKITEPQLVTFFEHMDAVITLAKKNKL